MGSPNAPWTVYVEALQKSVKFHCSLIPHMPAPKICRDDLGKTDSITERCRARRTLILGFLNGVEDLLISGSLVRASAATSMLALGKSMNHHVVCLVLV